MVYADTSVLVALYFNEARSVDADHWYRSTTGKMISAVWCVSEFASALGIKHRMGQLKEGQAQSTWRRFQRLCDSELHLLAVEAATFHSAAELMLDADFGLRAGDALHLAAALAAKATSMATLDEVLAKNAKRMKLKLAIRAG